MIKSTDQNERARSQNEYSRIPSLRAKTKCDWCGEKVLFAPYVPIMETPEESVHRICVGCGMDALSISDKNIVIVIRCGAYIPGKEPEDARPCIHEKGHAGAHTWTNPLWFLRKHLAEPYLISITDSDRRSFDQA